VEQRVEPAGGGRRVLRGDAVHVKVLAESVEQRKSLEAVLADVGEAIRTRLRELQCQVPRRFVVDVAYVRRLPDDWEPEQRLAVAVHNGERAVARRDAPDEGEGPPVLTIEVLRGQALKRHFTFRSVVVRLGRSPDPTDERGVAERSVAAHG
jgi:hypothetical protein